MFCIVNITRAIFEILRIFLHFQISHKDPRSRDCTITDCLSTKYKFHKIFKVDVSRATNRVVESPIGVASLHGKVYKLPRSREGKLQRKWRDRVGNSVS